MENSMWDPIKDTVTINSFIDEQMSLVKRVQGYRKNPYQVKIFLFLFSLLPIAAILYFATHTDLLNKDSMYIIFISFVPITIYYATVVHMQNELVLYLLCENNQWVFNPKQDDNRIQKLIVVYPQVFNQGHSQIIEDQIWGSIQYKEKVDFWRGSFSYITGYGKTSETYTRAVFIIKLHNDIPISFSLYKAGLFSKEDVKTESEEFNKLYKIETSDKDNITKAQVIKILSPSVQVRLINFAHNFPIESINFQKEVMILVFSNTIWGRKYTNFFKKVAIDERDESVFFAKLKEMIELPSEMVQFIK